MDHLFTMPLKGEIAAPPAYWLKQPCITSAIFVTEPTLDKWEKIKKHFVSAHENRYYDMNIINPAFEGHIHVLPEEYLYLNSEWETASCYNYLGNQDQSLNKVHLVHFTALGKPWNYSPRQVRRLRPNAHPTFYYLWEEWWKLRDDLIQGKDLPKHITRSFRPAALVRTTRSLINK